MSNATVPTLAVIYEDAHILAVNKPANMLSVPGRTRPRLPRQQEWTAAAIRAASEAPESCKALLEGLKRHHNIPRKEDSFLKFVKRTFKAETESARVEAWGMLKKTDASMHLLLPLEDIPEGWVSAAEIAEHMVKAQLHVVHRLDQPTSGVFLMAKNPEAAASLCEQFRERHMSKTYFSEVAGELDESIKTVVAKLRPNYDDKPRQVVDEIGGKDCETHVKVIAHKAESDSTLVELTPVTGRTHQLRMHMLSLGHPILGDGLYADKGVAGALPRLALHARTLKLSHPVTGEELVLEAPLDDFRGPLSKHVPWPDHSIKLQNFQGEGDRKRPRTEE